jgi:hypothetical protein
MNTTSSSKYKNILLLPHLAKYMKVCTKKINKNAGDYSYYALMATKSMNNNFQI